MTKGTSSESENEEDRPLHPQKTQEPPSLCRSLPVQPSSLPSQLSLPTLTHPMSSSSSSSSTVPNLTTSTSASVSMTLTASVAASSALPAQYIVEEETTTVKVPILRPRPGLLKVVHLGGGVGETFTMGEIIHHVKEYILERTLYDQQDPRIVHCRGDLLGEALDVDSFTINDAIGLFRKSCILEPDTRIRIRRHLVTRAVVTMETSQLAGGATAYTTATTGGNTTTRTSPSSPSTMLSKVSCKVSPDLTIMSQGSLYSQSGPSSSAQSSLSLSQPSSSFSSSGSSSVINFKAAKSSVTVTNSDIERSLGEQVVSSTDSSSDGGGRHRSRGVPRRRGTSKSDIYNRKRSTSINVTYDEPDGATGPWACEVTMETSAGEMAKAKDDTVVVEYDSDAFSVEYEVESDSENEARGNQQEEHGQSESDVSSSTSGTAFLVVCKESDVEYLADYSDSDNGSDTELTDADKWQCELCSEKNPPFQRNCAGCWSVRPDWLPSCGNDAESEGKTDSQDSAMTVASGSHKLPTSHQQINQESDLKKSSFNSSQDPSFNTAVSKNCQAGDENVKSSPKKRKYSSCLSTSDSQEEKMKGGEEPEEAVVKMETQSDEPKKPGKKKSIPAPAAKEDPCIVCLHRQKTASIIHGKTGHQVCCYRCARSLKKQRKACPVCRRPIQKVIRNFHL